MSENTQPTSLQFRLLQKQIDAIVPARLARLRHISLLQGLRRPADDPPVPTP